jgi:hypothetical protein
VHGIITFIIDSDQINFTGEERPGIQPLLLHFFLILVFLGFNCTYLLSALTSFKKKFKDFFPDPFLASKLAMLYFLCLNLAIALQSAVLW